MYLNCKYPYWRFGSGKPIEGFPCLTSLIMDYIDETDPVQRVKESNEQLKAELKHKRYGAPLPPRQITLKYKVRNL